MNSQQFLEHYGLAVDPFADEEASTDPIFKGYGITHAFHPDWNKIYGTPTEPTTSVVFGEKGSGKTALRMQMVRKLTEYNGANPDARVFVIPYDDFNPFIDRFREKQPFWRKNIRRALEQWKVWDHIDAILSLGVTQLLDRVLKVKTESHPAAPGLDDLKLEELSPSQVRDLLMLAMYYDQTSGEDRFVRWEKLRKEMKYHNLLARLPLPLGGAVGWTVVMLLLPFLLYGMGMTESWWGFYKSKFFWLAAAAGFITYGAYVGLNWSKAFRIRRGLRTLEQNQGELCKTLRSFPRRALFNQPVPYVEHSEDRYELLTKFQSILKTLGFPGVLVIVDRADEPYQVNGVPERMKALLWPMLDNKLLKHAGIGFKLLLPGELYEFVRREDDDFKLRARLDKQNLVPTFDWTGQALYDLANTRISGSMPPTHTGDAPRLEDFFDDTINENYLVHAFQSLKAPRRLFKFLYNVIGSHTKMYTDSAPNWKISQATFLSVMGNMKE